MKWPNPTQNASLINHLYKVGQTYPVPYNSTIKTTIIYSVNPKKGNSTNTTIVSQLKPDELPSSLNTKNWKLMAKWWHGLTQTYSWIPEINVTNDSSDGLALIRRQVMTQTNAILKCALSNSAGLVLIGHQASTYTKLVLYILNHKCFK